MNRNLPLTPEQVELNRGVARAQGAVFWDDIKDNPDAEPFGCYEGSPDYCRDLNAMHEVEMSLPDKADKPGEKSPRNRYRENLCIETIMAGGPITATAEQRARAYLKTVNDLKYGTTARHTPHDA